MARLARRVEEQFRQAEGGVVVQKLSLARNQYGIGVRLISILLGALYLGLMVFADFAGLPMV